MSRRRIVEVRWIDATCTLSEIDENDLPQPPTVLTWGLLLRSDERAVTVAAEWGRDPGNGKSWYRSTTAIPRGMIVGRVRTLGYLGEEKS